MACSSFERWHTPLVPTVHCTRGCEGVVPLTLRLQAENTGRCLSWRASPVMPPPARPDTQDSMVRPVWCHKPFVSFLRHTHHHIIYDFFFPMGVTPPTLPPHNTDGRRPTLALVASSSLYTYACGRASVNDNGTCVIVTLLCHISVKKLMPVSAALECPM